VNISVRFYIRIHKKESGGEEGGRGERERERERERINESDLYACL